jgi:acid stress-induced BolA-like protein IbaG/YrbA
MNTAAIKTLLENNLPGSEVRVEGADGVHFEAIVISDAFEGKTPVQQHRIVYQALQGKMENQEIHALALKTYTPERWHNSR